MSRLLGHLVSCAGILGLLAAGCAYGQQLTAALSGTTYDQTGAVVPKAKVTLKNEATGDTRTTVSNNDGVFTFSAVQPGTYDLTVTAQGFRPWGQNGIVLNQGDNRTLPNIALSVGETTQQVEVVAAASAIAPVDTGEVATNLNTQMVTDLPLQGRDAGEFFKIMPGMAMTNGLSQGSSFTDRVVGTNTGPIGAYSANGTQPNGAVAYMFDGANLVDPGNQGTQIADINQDFTSEIKMLMSGYDAAYAKGPVVFQAYGKSGGSHFHGEAYLYARNNIFNSLDSFQKSQGITKPDAYEYYPGGQIGGPVILPFTKFNRNRDKLFFWVGYEYMRQQPQGTLWQTFVPTAAMRAGDFSQATMAQIAALPGNHSAIDQVPCPAAGNTQGLSRAGGCDHGTPITFVNGQIPTSMMDPNSLALLKLYPQPNIDPATHSGYNFQYLDQSPQNRWELMEKVDYSVSDNTKITVSYNRQDETDVHPVQVWWAPAWSLPYASPLVAPTTANVTMANVTHVFSPTTTNETVFTYARYTNPIVPQNPQAINPATIGFQTTGLFGVKEIQIPNVMSWSGNQMFAGWIQQAVFGGAYNGGAFGATKSDPALYDNFTKVSGTHTMKFGFYWDMNGNLQSSGNQLNGTYDFENYGNTTTGNVYADFLLGRASGYNQANIIPVDNFKYHQYSLYGQDSWKAGKRLTINYGLRADHVGQWYPDNNVGAAVFNVGAFLANPNATNAGLQWHATNPSIPLSGFKSPLFYWEPRVGIAYDIFGDGKTVVRGGFAIFRYQLAYNTISSPTELPLGALNYSTPTGLTSLSQIYSFTPPTNLVVSGCNSCSIYPLQMGDGKTPYTENYNFSVDRMLPGRTLFEISYVGNVSRDLVWANAGQFGNINAVPLGAFFHPDPVTHVLNPIDNISNTNDYRPFQSYGDIDITTHGSYSNYNSLQATFQKSSGPITFLVNYTFEKVMGIRDNYSGNGPSSGNTVYPFNAAANYGVLAYNHTHILNSGFVFTAPRIGQGWVDSVAGGWQLSGTTQFQTGVPIQPNTNGTMYASYGSIPVNSGTITINGNTVPVSGNSIGLSTGTSLGSNAADLALVPLLTCNPMKNLQPGQYFNPSCFAPPPLGSNGTLVWPNIHGPAFFEADLNLMKNFKITETQKIQFRISAFNFLNRPNPDFTAGGNSDLTLNFSGVNNVLSQTNTNALLTGKPAHTVGDRLVELAIKYYF